MCELPCGLAVLEPHHAPLGQYGYYACHTELRCLLDHCVHAWAAAHALEQRDDGRRLQNHRDRSSKRYGYLVAAQRCNLGSEVATGTVEHHQWVPAPQTQYPGDVIGGVAVESHGTAFRKWLVGENAALGH